MKRIALILASLVLASTLSAYAPNTNENVRFGTPSTIGGTLLKRKGFVLRYDAVKKNPIWVSYHLKIEYLKNPLKAVFQFKPDPNIYPESNASNNDYAKSPYSRCRLAPLGDMSRSKDVMKECFYLTNVCPMDQQLYKGFWGDLEDAIRRFVMRDNEAWIIAGPVYNMDKDKKTKNKTIGNNKVAVPDAFFKIVFYQGKDGSFTAIGFIFENKKQPGDIRSYIVTVEDIEKMTGLVFLDKFPAEVGKLMKAGKPKEEKILDFLDIHVEKKQPES